MPGALWLACIRLESQTEGTIVVRRTDRARTRNTVHYCGTRARSIWIHRHLPGRPKRQRVHLGFINVHSGALDVRRFEWRPALTAHLIQFNFGGFTLTDAGI